MRIQIIVNAYTTRIIYILPLNFFPFKLGGKLEFLHPLYVQGPLQEDLPFHLVSIRAACNRMLQ